MLQTKWLIFLALVFVLGNILSGAIEGSYLGTNGGSNALNPIMNSAGLMSQDAQGQTTSIPLNPNVIQKIWTWLSWDYSFFTGPYALVQLLLRCISVGIAISIILTLLGLIRGTSV